MTSKELGEIAAQAREESVGPVVCQCQWCQHLFVERPDGLEHEKCPKCGGNFTGSVAPILITSAARDLVPRLVSEVRRLQRELDSKKS